MTATPLTFVPEENSAVAYKRAHTGKLMVFLREEGRELVESDFFYFDAVGTHPTGLMVTGMFTDERRSHMMASAVRDANDAEHARHKQLKEERMADTSLIAH